MRSFWWSRSDLLPNSSIVTDPASRLDNLSRERMRHLHCIAFLRPSSDTVQHLIDELREPRYGTYSICE